VGDVIAYRIPPDEPGAGALVIHRITGGAGADGYRTQGDNRERHDLWRPRPAEIQGRMWAHVPGVGRVFPLVRQPLVMATVAALLTFLTLGFRPHRPPPLCPANRTSDDAGRLSQRAPRV
jgi:signal peptidase I